MQAEAVVFRQNVGGNLVCRQSVEASRILSVLFSGNLVFLGIKAILVNGLLTLARKIAEKCENKA